MKRPKQYIILTIKFLFFCNSIYCQNIEETFRFAEYSFSQNRYDAAISAYHRTVYFSESITKSLSYIKLAKCYEAIHDNDKALQYYDVFISSGNNDSLIVEAIFSKIGLLILSKKNELATFELIKYNDLLIQYDYKRKAFLEGIIYYYSGDYYNAEKLFIKCINDSVGETVLQIKELIQQTKKIEKRYNPIIARNLSLFLYSSGQFYIGEYKEGLNSLMLNTFFFALFSYVSISYSIYDAVILVTPWLLRYYSGGYEKAYLLAVNKKENKKKELMNKILMLMAKDKK